MPALHNTKCRGPRKPRRRRPGGAGGRVPGARTRIGRCLMPKSAAATSQRRDNEATTTGLDELIQRGRSQGHLSLPELRAAFERAQISPTEARSIIRELTEVGVQLGNDQPEAPVQAATLPSTSARKPRSRASGRKAGSGERATGAAGAEVIELDGLDAA